MQLALETTGLTRPSERVGDCAQELFYLRVVDTSTGEITMKLKNAAFCHWRHCPICQWRKSLKNKAILMTALPKVLQKYPTSRFAMLTLTVKNCQVSDLRSTIETMNEAWKRLILRETWPALGWVRAVEVTRSKSGSVHPHFHCLLMLPADYFGRKYISTRAWVQLWREAARLDYDPICDIRTIKPKVKISAEIDDDELRLLALASSVSEVVKYATKTADLLSGGPDFLREYVAQVKNLKFLTSGGELKGIIKDMKKEDLVHLDEEKDAENGFEILGPPTRFDWYKIQKKYGRKRRT